MSKTALYFGCWNSAGHFLHDRFGRHVYDRDAVTPWHIGLMDTGLLRNGKIVDEPTGRVFWTCGGAKEFWFAFYWWDRSVDRRPASNSGFYVCGFDPREIKEAFEYACSLFPTIVARQVPPLILEARPHQKARN